MSTRDTADIVVAKAIDHHTSTDTNLSDVANALSQDHAHRPGMWQQDLQKANEKLHAQGILHGMDIIGIKGQDLITRDQDGKTHRIDSSDIASSKDLRDPYSNPENHSAKTPDINGRHANLGADGSGVVHAKGGDKHQWELSKDLLKAQGVDNPTGNQMANFQKELEALNGKSVSEFKAGDLIRVPPSSQSGDQTAFNDEHNKKKLDHADHKVEQQVSEAQDALKKFNTATFTTSMTKEDIVNALGKPDLTTADQKGLQFLNDHYSELSSPSSGMWRSAIYKEGLAKYQAKAEFFNHNQDPRDL